jgi:hypothetical protein
VRKLYIFRFDGARENDEFLEQARLNGHFVYAGLKMQLQHGWIPDFVEVSIDDETSNHAITIIELESTESVALVSARKYLPESSKDVLSIFRKYLGRVLQRCRLNADPRLEGIKKVHDLLSTLIEISIWSAGGLRQPPQIVERLSLFDQGHATEITCVDEQQEKKLSSLTGILALSPRDHKTLSRSILILDAVIRGWDKSDASLRAWRSIPTQPLRRQIQQYPDDFPTLTVLLLGEKSGVQILMDDAAQELSVIWNQSQPGCHTDTSVLAVLSRFFPVDRTLDPNESVRIAFDKARLILTENTA